MRLYAVAIILSLSGCSLFESREQSSTVEVERRTGQEGGYPVDVTVQRTAQTTAQAQLSSPVLTQATQAGGGLLGLLSGAGGVTGLAGIAFAMFKSKQAKTESEYGDGERARAERAEMKLNRALAALPPETAKDIA
jgi:hypothetical protein